MGGLWREITGLGHARVIQRRHESVHHARGDDVVMRLAAANHFGIRLGRTRHRNLSFLQQ